MTQLLTPYKGLIVLKWVSKNHFFLNQPLNKQLLNKLRRDRFRREVLSRRSLRELPERRDSLEEESKSSQRRAILLIRLDVWEPFSTVGSLLSYGSEEKLHSISQCTLQLQLEIEFPDLRRELLIFTEKLGQSASPSSPCIKEPSLRISF